MGVCRSGGWEGEGAGGCRNGEVGVGRGEGEEGFMEHELINMIY